MAQVEGLTDQQVAEIKQALAGKMGSSFSLPSKSDVVRLLRAVGKEALARLVNAMSDKVFRKLLDTIFGK